MTPERRSSKEDVTGSRRVFLKAAGVAAAGALAGCMGGDGGDGGGGTAAGDGGDGGSDGGGGNGGGATTTASPDPTSVTVATTQTGSLGVLTAIIEQEGLDEAHGVAFEIQDAAPPQAMQLLRNEAVNVSIFSPQGAAVANTQGSNIRLFGPGLANHISLMTTTDNESVQGWEDLVGKGVGIMSPPSGMWNHARLLLAERGYTVEDFDFREGAPGAIHSFNARGDVAAHLHFIPVTIGAIASGEMREVLFMPDSFQEIFGHNLQFVPIAAHQSWLDENAETARNVRAAYVEAQTLFKESPQETISTYKDVIGLESDAAVQAATERMPATYPAEWGTTQKENVVTQLERSKENGLIPENAPTDIVADL